MKEDNSGIIQAILYLRHFVQKLLLPSSVPTTATHQNLSKLLYRYFTKILGITYLLRKIHTFNIPKIWKRYVYIPRYVNTYPVWRPVMILIPLTYYSFNFGRQIIASGDSIKSVFASRLYNCHNLLNLT